MFRKTHDYMPSRADILAVICNHRVSIKDIRQRLVSKFGLACHRHVHSRYLADTLAKLKKFRIIDSALNNCQQMRYWRTEAWQRKCCCFA